MKKLVIALAIVAMAAIAQEQTFKFPGWGCKDVTLLQEQLALAPDDCMKMTITYHLDFASNGQPATFVDACTRIEAAINAVKPGTAEDTRLSIMKQFASCTGQFKADLIAYCKDNPSSYDLHIALADNTDWGYQTATNCLLKYSYPANHVIRAVDYLNRQAIALGKDDAEVLDLLKKLNRVFSGKLTGVEDDPWGTVVAKIRTLMETYK